MDKKQKQIIIISLLVVFLIVVWVNAFKAIGKKSKKKTAASATAAAVSKPSTQKIKTKSKVADKKEEDLEWVRCPFSGSVYSGTSIEMADLKLMGIFWDEKSPRAIINNKVVNVGASIDINTVLGIEKDRVILSDGLRIFELKLGR